MNLIRLLSKNKKHNFRYLSLQKYKPDVIIDIGVFQGTPNLYLDFKDCKFILVDPLLSQNYNELQKYQFANSPVLVNKALSNKEGTLEFYFEREREGRSTFFQRSTLSENEVKSVEVVTLDSITRNYSKDTRFGIKIDTEGSELNILKGGLKTLKNTNFLVLEVSVGKRFEDQYQFHQLIEFLLKNNFYLYDILDISRSDSCGTKYADMAFIKK